MSAASQIESAARPFVDNFSATNCFGKIKFKVIVEMAFQNQTLKNFILRLSERARDRRNNK